jgi:hypothetical protein
MVKAYLLLSQQISPIERSRVQTAWSLGNKTIELYRENQANREVKTEFGRGPNLG